MKCYKEVRHEFLPSKEFSWVTYYEFDGPYVKRQIEIFPEVTLLLTGGECCEVSLEDMEFDPADQVETEFFERLWEQYSAKPHGTRKINSPFIRSGFKGVLPRDPAE